MSAPTMTAECPACGWLEGISNRPPCATCDGSGTVRRRKTVDEIAEENAADLAGLIGRCGLPGSDGRR